MPAYPARGRARPRRGRRASQWLTAPTRFLGTDRLEGVECIRMELGEPDASGRRRPEPVPGSEHVVPADTAIIAIGQQPRPEFSEIGRSSVDRRVRAGPTDDQVLRRGRRHQRRRHGRRGRRARARSRRRASIDLEGAS